jgi:hypothetical protein
MAVRGKPLTGRHAAMAFTVAAALPVTFNLPQAGYLFGVFVLAAAARTVDYLIAGPLPRQPAVPLQPPSGQCGWLRYALAFAGASTAALWIGQALDPTHTIWVVATTLVVMQADARLSYRRIVERIEQELQAAANMARIDMRPEGRAARLGLRPGVRCIVHAGQTIRAACTAPPPDSDGRTGGSPRFFQNPSKLLR